MTNEPLEINIVLHDDGDAAVVWDGYRRVKCNALDDNHPTAQLVGEALKEYFERRGQSVTLGVLTDQMQP